MKVFRVAILIVWLAINGTAASPRPVVVEIFTGTWCPYCYHAESAIHELTGEYDPTELIPLAYHQSDEFSSLDTERRGWQYGIQSFPTVIFGGSVGMVGGYEGMVDDFREIIDQESRKTSEYTVEGEFTLTQTEVTMNVSVVAGEAAEKLEIDVVEILVEREIDFEGANGLSPQEFVVRDMSQPERLTLEPAGTTGRETAFELEPSWSNEELYGVVLVQNSETGEVLQARRLVRESAVRSWAVHGRSGGWERFRDDGGGGQKKM